MKNFISEANTYDFPSGTVDSGKVVAGGTGGNWGGSMERALEIASFARKCSGKKNPISSQKRSRVKTASGNVSDHYEGNLSAYAVDLPARGETGDKLLACIMDKFENGAYSNYIGGKWLNVNVDGYRYQFGWKVKNHYDHIHVGVKKIGAGTPNTPGKITDINYDDFPADEQKIIKQLFNEFNKEGIDDPFAKMAFASYILDQNRDGKAVSDDVVDKLTSGLKDRSFKNVDEALTYIQGKVGSGFSKSEVKKVSKNFTGTVKDTKGKEKEFTFDKVVDYVKNFAKGLFENEEEIEILKEDVQRMNDIMKKNL